MYVVFLNYVRPVEEVEALLAAHIEWLDRYFDAGFLLQRDVKIRARAACYWSGDGTRRAGCNFSGRSVCHGGRV